MGLSVQLPNIFILSTHIHQSEITACMNLISISEEYIKSQLKNIKEYTESSQFRSLHLNVVGAIAMRPSTDSHFHHRSAMTFLV